MADSIGDVALIGEWLDAYDATGITVGGALSVQNKSSSPVYMWISATSPVDGFREGQVMYPRDVSYVTAGESGLWLWGIGPVSIQEG